ncbi:hypothetical protein [Salegentibacter sp.]|uniref:hypothetical protein n=1 Tax=Salegentibacter sp. TaxID=1903072 RepID=UPI00356A53EF
MDTASTLIGLSLLVIFLGPIFYLILIENRKNIVGRQALLRIADANALQPKEIEVNTSVYLGLDARKKKLIYINYTNKNEFKVIDLNIVSNVNLETKDFPEKPGKINFISLKFTGKSKSEGNSELVFYDEYGENGDDAEVQYNLARKWQKFIENCLKN